jgi:hypothetical protein
MNERMNPSPSKVEKHTKRSNICSNALFVMFNVVTDPEVPGSIQSAARFSEK